MQRKLTESQQQQADERKARFRALVKRVADMPDDERDQLAASMASVVTCEGRALSAHNSCLIYFQNPGATLVGGFRQWIKQGRAVRKGEHGLMIWVPLKRRGDSDAGAVQVVAVDAKPSETRFIMGTVFDVSQTMEIETCAAVAV